MSWTAAPHRRGRTPPAAVVVTAILLAGCVVAAGVAAVRVTARWRPAPGDPVAALAANPRMRARPAYTGTVLRLHAADQGRAEITALVAWHVSVTTDALALYTRLRAGAGHYEARATALQTIGDPLPGCGARNGVGPPGPACGAGLPPSSRAESADRPQRPRGAEIAQIFPADRSAAAPSVTLSQASRPPGRGFPPGPRR